MSLWLSLFHARILGLLAATMAGLVSLALPTGAAELPNRPGDPDASNGSRTVMILGVSWQPAYCENRPQARECAKLGASSPAGRQFSLHGLWAMKKSYCGVDSALKAQDKSKKWLELPELALEETVRFELAAAMPGVASGLDRHEWIMHGTCSGQLASAYYQRSLSLLAALNQSPVQDLFEQRIGQTLSQDAVQQAFDQAFGPGSGEKVRMRCRKVGVRNLITGLTIGLGQGGEADGLASLIAGAGRTKFGCTEGVVDAAGQQ